MAKVIERPIKPGKATLSKEKITVRDGRLRHFYPANTVSANSGSFANDLGQAFRDNVEAALRKKK